MYEQIYNFFSVNLSLFRLLYSLFITLVCSIIVLKTHKMFKVSHHQGIRYFRNAFFFYGIAFIFRYLLSMVHIALPFFEFFMIMAGFFLLYSLVWKEFEIKDSYCSLFNSYIFSFYIITLLMVLIDSLLGNFLFLFLSQIVIFGITSIISFKNIKKGGFSKLYHIAMVLSFFAWMLNMIFVFFLSDRLRFVGNIYILNMIVFIIILYGVSKITR